MLKRESANGGLEALSVKIKSLEEINAKVGWLSSTRYKKEKHDSVELVTDVAKLNEEGDLSVNRPPRPFTRNAITKYKNKWLKIGGLESLKVLKGNIDYEQASETIGMIVAADWRQSIVDFTTPPIKPATIQARLNRKIHKKKVGLLTKPLEDSGYMLATLTHTTD